MRIRLDKLFLSAGLALAVIATTIPVGATVTTQTVTTNGKSETTVTADEGLVKDNTAVDLSKSDDLKAFYSALVGSSVADNVSLAATGNTTTSTSSTATASDILNAKVKVTEPTVGVSAGKQVEAIEITATKTIDLSTELAAFKSATKDATEKTTVAAAASTFAKALASKTEEATTDSKYNYGTYDVATVATTASPTVASLAAAVAAVDETSQTDFDNAIAACQTAADSTYTQVTTYTVTSLPTGYSFDVILGDASDATNFKHTVYSQDRTAAKTNEEITDITELTNGKVAISVTDFNLDYFLVTTQVSTSTDLITGYTDPNDGLTVTIAGVEATAVDATAKEKIDASVEENGYKLVSYLDIDVTDGGVALTSTDKEITFTIDVPVDMPEGVTYKVLRLHDGTVDVLDTTVADGKITFTSRLFSDFALVYTAADTTEEETNNETESATESGTETTTAGGSSTTSTTTSTKTADNSMMPLFMTTLLLALCAGSLAIYKEKKTN